MHRGELLFFLLVLGIFSIHFFKARAAHFFDFTTLPPKIMQWELDSCTRTISIHSVLGGIPPYDFYVFKQDLLDSSNWPVYRFIKEQLPQISGLPPGNYRIKAVNEGVTSPSSGSNTLAVSFPSDPEIEIKGSTSLCSGEIPSLQLLHAASPLPFLWTARVLQAPEDGELLGHNSSSTPQFKISDTLINTGKTLAKVSYQLQTMTNGCLSPPRSVVVQVNPQASIAATLSDSVRCSGTPFSISLLPKSWGASPMQVQWTAELLSGQVTGLGEGGRWLIDAPTALSQTLINQGASPARVRYTFSPSFQGCLGIDAVLEVVVLPEPQVFPQKDLVACAGELVSLPEFELIFSGDSVLYSWEVSDPTLGLSRGTGARIPNFLAIHEGNSSKKALITVTPTVYFHGVFCIGPPYTFSITVSAPLVVEEEVSNYAGFGVSCAGAADGTIRLYTKGGILPEEEQGYTYLWTGPGGFVSNSAYLKGLQAGIYRVRVATTTTEACVLEKSITLTQPDPLWIQVIYPADGLVALPCAGAKSGKIQVKVGGGSGEKSLLWTARDGGFIPVGMENSSFLEGINRGNYQLTVTDENGCRMQQIFTVTEPKQLTLAQSQVNNVCFQGNRGSISITASGGTAPYGYFWTGPNGFTSTNEDLSTLVSGTYQVTVTDANGCTLMGSTQTITEPTQLSLTQSQVDNTCFQGTLGSISITASGGTAPYRYSWSGPNGFIATNEDLTVLASGTYQVTVTDSNGCILTGAPQTITEPTQLTLTQSQVNNVCVQGNTACISITTSGGTAPYRYFWTGPNGFASTNEDLTALASGTYQVMVRDASGCSIIGVSQTITEPTQLSLTQSQVNNTCFQGTSGSISITASGGTAPYGYSWTGPNGFTSRNEDLSTLISGTYQVTVRDANGCTIQGAPQTITEPPVMSINAQVQSESCAEARDGWIKLTLSGGTPPYRITWEHGNIDALATGLGAGTYRVHVTDQSGCSQVGEYTLLPIAPLSLQTTTTLQATQVPLQISAFLQATATGGTPPYTYRWSTGQSTAQIMVFERGVYGIEMLDSKGCSQESEVAVTLPLPINLSLQVATVPLCEEGGQETSVQLLLTGGLPPYQITWSRPGVSTDGSVFTTRESGDFEVEVKDALGLVEKRSFTIAPRLTGSLNFSYVFASQAEFQGDLVGFDVNFSPLATWPHQLISWDFGDGTSSSQARPIHTFSSKGRYTVTLTVLDNSGCIIKSSQEIQVLDYFLEIPNVFTPNGDELNDTFFPKFRFIRNLQLQVMNKWGELIYRSRGQDDLGWDGTAAGQKAPEGVYVYKLSYQVPDGRTITSSSTFLLAR